jgi:nitroreductase
MSNSSAIDQAIRDRKSIRVFRPDPVPRQVIEEILDVARWAPSGSNIQPWRVTVVGGERADTLRRRLEEAASVRTWTETQTTAMQERIANGPMAWILDCVDEPIWEFLAGGSMRFFDAPVALLVSFSGKKGTSAPAGIPAFVTTLMLAAHARGLGTVWLGWPMGQAEVVREEFELPEDEQASAFIALGYPDPDAPVNQARSTRYEVDAFCRWIGWE